MDAQGAVIGMVAIGLGAGWMLLGYRLALVLLPLWGFFAGFLFGAQGAEAVLGDGFLTTPVGWVVGGVIGLVLGILSYLFWYAAVVVAFASVGFWLASGILTLVGFSESPLWAFAIGLVVAAAFAAGALLAGVPLVALVVITALGGAHASVAGVLVVLRIVEVGALGPGVVSAVIQASVGWWLAALGLTLIAITIQLRTIGEFVLVPPAARI